MKRMLSMLLVLAMLLSSLSGCGGSASRETTAPATTEAAKAPAEAATEAPTEAPAEEPTTEPTLSPEEILYNSLPEKVRRAVDLGVVELDVLDDLTRICTGKEAAEMLQNARVLKRGTESLILSQVKDSEHADIEVTRYWMAQMMHAVEMEMFIAPPSEDYLENLQYLIWDGYSEITGEESAYFHQPQWLVSENYGVTSHTNINQKERFEQGMDQDAVVAHGYMTGIADFLEGSWEVANKPEDWVKYVDYGSPESMGFALLFYDKTTGEKLIPWTEAFEFLPREKMTVEAAVEAALRYYNYFPEEAQMLAYTDVPAYDSSIITDDLLTKETTLPEASCQHLPVEWKGVELRDLLYSGDVDAKVDARIYESEIQLIGDAGFNYVRILFDFEYFMSETADMFHIYTKIPDEGMMNENHLKELDQIIAWCMERDIHVNLVCTDVIGWSDRVTPNVILANTGNAKPMAEQWQVLARRYADIPNTYLSFTLLDNPSIAQDAGFGKFFGGVVEAIREVSPERCIIADLSLLATGESMAQLGVALSSRAVLPDNFEIDPKAATVKTAGLFESVAWPYETNGKAYDGPATMVDIEGWVKSAPDDVAAVAEQYGVGFMVSGWAPFTSYGTSTRRDRFNDDMMQSFLADMTQTMTDRGYGWCYGNWFGFVGFGAAYPAIDSTTYTKINDAPLYVDDETFGWFAEINGVC
ncbi:MAG: cellulase family glycosylhydrolase [Oscillospiraceae bacterium]|nr:cellulase family glycosylhydrolase [Oscillospiraceae bacterium]